MNITASSLWRVAACPASATLPRIRRAHADAEAGTAAHAVLALEATPGTAEVGFSLDVAAGTASETEPRNADGYAPRPGCIQGTADVVEMRGAQLCVDDHKTGFGYMVAPAKSNLQLAFYGLCAALAYGQDSVKVRLLDADGKTTSEALLDAFDLADTLDRIRAIWREAAAPAPKLVAGAHCWRCECVENCPAHQTALVAMGTGKLDGVLTTEALVQSIAAAKVAARALKGFWAAVYAIAAREPIALGGGRWFGERETTTKALDGDVVRQVVRDMHGAEVADKAIEASATQASLERALATIAPKGKKAAMVREALAEIEKRNGITKTHSTKIEEYTAAPAAEGESNAA